MYLGLNTGSNIFFDLGQPAAGVRPGARPAGPILELQDRICTRTEFKVLIVWRLSRIRELHKYRLSVPYLEHLVETY